MYAYKCMYRCCNMALVYSLCDSHNVQWFVSMVILPLQTLKDELDVLQQTFDSQEDRFKKTETENEQLVSASCCTERSSVVLTFSVWRDRLRDSSHFCRRSILLKSDDVPAVWVDVWSAYCVSVAVNWLSCPLILLLNSWMRLSATSQKLPSLLTNNSNWKESECTSSSSILRVEVCCG